MTDKQVRARYTPEYKLEAIRQVRSGQAVSVVAKVLGLPKATLSDCAQQRARRAGQPNAEGDDHARANGSGPTEGRERCHRPA